MDGDSDDAVASLVALLDFILNPRPERGFLPDADYSYGTSGEVVVDPAPDGGIAASFDGFPFGVVQPSGVGVGCALGDPRVSDLGDAPDVAVIVEAEEDFSWHGVVVVMAIVVAPAAKAIQSSQ